MNITVIFTGGTIGSSVQQNFVSTDTQMPYRLLAMYETEQKKKGAFRFVVDDNVVYHTLADFRSAEARKQYQTLSQKQKDLDNLSETLGKQRELYGQSNKAGKGRLTPAILDKEQRIKQLREEIASLTVNIRNTELKALNRK